jgi:hypothetical protein
MSLSQVLRSVTPQQDRDYKDSGELLFHVEPGSETQFDNIEFSLNLL